VKRICGALRRLAFPLAAAAVALACAALLAGCKKETQLKIGEKAPELAALDLNYGTVKLSDFRGKVVVLRFWSTGCKACIAEMPKIDEFSKRYQDRGLAVIAVNVGDTKEKVADFVESLKISYPVLLDEANITARKYRVTAVPTTCFIDRNGIAKKIVFGEMIQGQMEKTVRELL